MDGENEALTTERKLKLLKAEQQWLCSSLTSIILNNTNRVFCFCVSIHHPLLWLAYRFPFSSTCNWRNYKSRWWRKWTLGNKFRFSFFLVSCHEINPIQCENWEQACVSDTKGNSKNKKKKHLKRFPLSYSARQSYNLLH